MNGYIRLQWMEVMEQPLMHHVVTPTRKGDTIPSTGEAEADVFKYGCCCRDISNNCINGMVILQQMCERLAFLKC